MTQFSMLPWTTGVSGDGAAPYTQEQSNNFFRFFDVRDPAAEGVVLGVLNELAVSGSSSPLSVAAGAAVCYGRYWNDSAASLTVSTPGVGTTGGRVVLRCTWATRQIRLAVKMSANGIATPPSLTQTFGSTWEISLATFTITTGGAITLTDDRSFRKATFQVDTAAIQNDAVATAKIANAAVTTPKIADEAVTTPKIGPGVVTLAKLATSLAPWEVISTITLASAQDITALNFSSIPATYTHLRIVLQWRFNSGGTATVGLRFNGDTGNNYSYLWQSVGQSGTVQAALAATNNARVGLVSGNVSNNMDTAFIDIPFYRESFHKHVFASQGSRSAGAASDLLMLQHTAWWASTAAITAIGWITGITLATGSKAILYGQ